MLRWFQHRYLRLGTAQVDSSLNPTIYIAPWKVFLRSGITRLPFGRVLTISAAIAVAVRQSSASFALGVFLFLFEISFVAARISVLLPKLALKLAPGGRSFWCST